MQRASFFDLPRELRDLVYTELWDRNTAYLVSYAGHTFAVRISHHEGAATHTVWLGNALTPVTVARRQIFREALEQLQRSATWIAESCWGPSSHTQHDPLSQLISEHMSFWTAQRLRLRLSPAALFHLENEYELPFPLLHSPATCSSSSTTYDSDLSRNCLNCILTPSKLLAVRLKHLEVEMSLDYGLFLGLDWTGKWQYRAMRHLAGPSLETFSLTLRLNRCKIVRRSIEDDEKEWTVQILTFEAIFRHFGTSLFGGGCIGGYGSLAWEGRSVQVVEYLFKGSACIDRRT